MGIKVGLLLEEATVQRIDAMSEASRRSKSAIVDMAVELLAKQDEFSSIKLPRKRTALSVDKVRGGEKVSLPEAA